MGTVDTCGGTGWWRGGEWAGGGAYEDRCIAFWIKGLNVASSTAVGNFDNDNKTDVNEVATLSISELLSYHIISYHIIA